MDIKVISNKKEWRKLLKTYLNEFEIIIYKFSPICALSHSTDLIIDNWCKSQVGNNNLMLLKVNVVLSRALYKTIEKELKIGHESPQIIWLDKEKNLKFSASHCEINNIELNKHLYS